MGAQSDVKKDSELQLLSCRCEGVGINRAIVDATGVTTKPDYVPSLTQKPLGYRLSFPAGPGVLADTRERSKFPDVSLNRLPSGYRSTRLKNASRQGVYPQ